MEMTGNDCRRNIEDELEDGNKQRVGIPVSGRAGAEVRTSVFHKDLQCPAPTPHIGMHDNPRSQHVLTLLSGCF